MTKDAISDAITALIKDFSSIPTEAVMIYKVVSRIVQQNLLQVMGSQNSRKSSNCSLNPQQKQALQNYFKRLDVAGILTKLSRLFGAVNYLLK